MEKIHTPNLVLLKYVGKVPRRLWEVKGINIPTLEEGDGVLLPLVTATLLSRQKIFEISKDEGSIVFAGENHVFEDIGDLTEDELEKLANSTSIIVPIENEKEDEKATILKPLEEFEDADALEVYGLTFGIDLNKAKTLEHMYQDLTDFVLNKSTDKEDDKKETITVTGVNSENENEKVEVKYSLPKIEDIDTLSDEEVIEACKFLEIKVGRKKADTLKPLLLAALSK